jgi:hypothetical protein
MSSSWSFVFLIVISMLLSMSISQALVYECKVTKDWAISRYDIIEKSYEIQQRMTAIAKIPIGFSLKKSGLGNESFITISPF